MKTITITTDGTGNGRVKNPFDEWIGAGEFQNYMPVRNTFWLNFDLANPPMPVFQNGVPFKVKGEFQAVVKWQYWNPAFAGMWVDLGFEPKEIDNMRPVFEIITPQELPTESERGKIDKSIIFGPGNDNYGRNKSAILPQVVWDENDGDGSEILGHISYDHQKQTKTFVPVSKQPTIATTDSSIKLDSGEPLGLGKDNGILPCPFCGAKEGHGPILGKRDHLFLITCINCNVQTGDDRRDKVIYHWNRRDIVKPDTSTVEELAYAATEAAAPFKNDHGYAMYKSGFIGGHTAATEALKGKVIELLEQYYDIKELTDAIKAL